MPLLAHASRHPDILHPAVLPPLHRLELPTEDVQSNVRLMGVRQGRGAAIVIAAVEPGSAAAAAGVRPGQQLLAVSDPIRRGEFWQINGQSSLRYVRQAISMRVADSIALQLTAQPIREWRRAIEASRAAQRAAAAALTQQPLRSADQPQDDDLLSNIVRASIDSSMSSVSSMDSFDASDASGASADGDGAAPGPALTAAGRAAATKLTVAEKLEQRYIEGQAAADALAAQESDLERRKRRRKEYFEQVGRSRAAQLCSQLAGLRCQQAGCGTSLFAAGWRLCVPAAAGICAAIRTSPAFQLLGSAW